jgi:hypothetical protein
MRCTGQQWAVLNTWTQRWTPPIAALRRLDLTQPTLAVHLSAVQSRILPDSSSKMGRLNSHLYHCNPVQALSYHQVTRARFRSKSRDDPQFSLCSCIFVPIFSAKWIQPGSIVQQCSTTALLRAQGQQQRLVSAAAHHSRLRNDLFKYLNNKFLAYVRTIMFAYMLL